MEKTKDRRKMNKSEEKENVEDGENERRDVSAQKE